MRARLAATLSALALGLTALPAHAAGKYPDPIWVATQPAGTCFQGSTEDRTCAGATPIATDYRLAGLAQTNAILAAHPELDQDETACPGAMWHASVLVSRYTPAQFTARYGVPAGVTVGNPTVPIRMPKGWIALQVNGTSAYSLLQYVYHQQQLDGPVATGLVSLLYFFTPSGAPRASGTPGSMPLPTTLPLWKPPVPVAQKQPLVLFDLAPAKVHDTLDTLWNDPIAGHGVFIQSIADAAFGPGKAPLVDVTDADGLYSEASIARALIGRSMVPGTIASLSSGTYQCTIEDLPAPPMLLAQAVLDLRKRGVHLVAAAGNDNLDTYFYPAAYAEDLVPVSTTGKCTLPQSWDPVAKLCSADATSTVTAVGSLASESKDLATYISDAAKPAGASDFSNYGTWVEAWADGDDVVGSYVDGPFRYCILDTAGTKCDLGDGTGLAPEDAPTAHLGSTVLWSGTSFAAPMVAIWLAAGNPAP